MKLIRFAIQQSLLMNLLTIFLVVYGSVRAYQMQREAFPAIDFDIVSVATNYPGASPKEVEQYVTTPLERELKAVTGIKESNSISIEGFSLIILKLDPDQSDRSKRKTLDDLQQAVDQTTDLPEDLQDPPLVQEATSGDMPIIEIAVAGDVPYADLHAVVEQLEDRLESLSGISKVETKGLQEKEFWVLVDPTKMRRYNVSLMNIVTSLAARNVNLPGGSIKTPQGELLVRAIGEVKTSAEIENIVLRSNDANIAIDIGDVGEVVATFEEEKNLYRTNGRSSINLNVIKTSSGDIISLVDQVKGETDAFLAELNNDQIQVSYVNDLSIFVRNRLGVLMNNGAFGIILVLCSLLLLLSPGIAFVAAFGMPVAFMGAIAMMGLFGMTINLITMFALVIVLGMLVDDAIIVAENIWHHYENGSDPVTAAIEGTSEVFWPVTATILTSIAAFSPLLMVSGIFGKFIQHMPMVVILALTMSLLEAMLVLPSHAVEAMTWHTRRKNWQNRRRLRKAARAEGVTEVQKKKDHSQRLNIFLGSYEFLLRVVLKGRWVFFTLTVGVFLGSIFFAVKRMPLILFPPEGVESFFVQADLPVAFSLEHTAAAFRQVEDMVRAEIKEEELQNFVTTIGKQQVDPNDPFTQRGSHLGQVQVFLTPEQDRERLAIDIINDLREKANQLVKEQKFERIIFERVRNGPPVGKPVAIRVRGDNFDQLEAIAVEIMAELETMEGVFDVAKNFREGKEELLVNIDDKAASRSLLTVDDIAKHIRAAFAGQIASYVRSADERIAMRVRYPERYREDLSSLGQIGITNARGNVVELDDVANVTRGKGVNAVFHRDFRRTVTVTASIDDQVTTSDWVNKAILPYLEELEQQHSGILISAGGEWEETNESMQSLFQAFAFAMALIYLILATQFGSLSQPLVVMTAIPFGIIGVIWAFYFHSLPLSFLGFIGIIGLTGVIVNDSIVLVDFINKARERGMAPIEAALYAGKRRFRAVWLTTLTTVFGLLPLVYGIGGMDKFLQPAAVALGYGLIFGTVLVLLLVPAVYLMLVDTVERIFPRKPDAGEAI